jgi:membrane protein
MATNGRRKHSVSPTSWVDAVVRRLPGPVQRLIERARADDVPLVAAGLAFYALVSVFPLAIVSWWIAGLVAGEQRISELADQLGRMLPEELHAGQLLHSVGEQGTRLGVVAVVAGLWPATAYGSGLARAFDDLASHHERRRTPLLGRGLALIALLPLFVVGTIVVSLGGTRVLGDAGAGQVVGVAVAFGGGFVIAAVAIGLLYTIFPPERLRWRTVIQASASAAGGVSLLTLLFVLFVQFGTNFAERYATSTIAAFVLLGVWLFLSNALVLMGYKLALEIDGRDHPGDGRRGQSRGRSRPRARASG